MDVPPKMFCSSWPQSFLDTGGRSSSQMGRTLAPARFVHESTSWAFGDLQSSALSQSLARPAEWTRRVQQFSGAAVQQFSSPPVQQRSSAEMQHLSSSAVQQGSTSAVEQLSQQRSSSAVQEFRISAAKQPSSKALKETLRFKGRPQD